MNTSTTDDDERRLRVAAELLARGIRRALGREALPSDDGEVLPDLASDTASSRDTAENQALPVREQEAVMGRAATARCREDEPRERRSIAR